MIKFISFSSGSAGNCYYIGNELKGILIDAGVSLRRLKSGLADAGLGFDDFSAVLVTHDHLDHIRHLGSYCKKICKPVWTTEKLHGALASHTFTRDHIAGCRRYLKAGEINEVAGFEVRWFEVPHDATQTVGYVIDFDGHRIVIMTDAGRVPDEFIEYASTADTVIIESNYDMDMLMGGPYTYDLKMRICKGNGHSSNDECASAIRRFWHPGLRNLFLCHLSENNNTPSRAYDCAAGALASLGVAKGAINLRTLPRRTCSGLIIL